MVDITIYFAQTHKSCTPFTLMKCSVLKKEVSNCISICNTHDNKVIPVLYMLFLVVNFSHRTPSYNKQRNDTSYNEDMLISQSL